MHNIAVVHAQTDDRTESLRLAVKYRFTHTERTCITGRPGDGTASNCVPRDDSRVSTNCRSRTDRGCSEDHTRVANCTCNHPGMLLYHSDFLQFQEPVNCA